MKKYILFAFFFPLIAQAVQVISQVDKNTVALNESFVWTLKIDSHESISNQVDIPDLSPTNDFYLLGQWSSQQSSVSILNGQMEKTNTVFKNYRLQPKKPGVFEIKSIRVRVKGRDFQTKPLRIKVTPASQKSPPPPQTVLPLRIPAPFMNPDSLFDIFTNPFQNREIKKSDVKLWLRLNKKSVYKSEMLKASWFILQSSGGLRYELYKKPALKGFWQKEIKIKNPRSFSGTQAIGQTLYRKKLLESLWLFPLRSGELNIDSYAIRVQQVFGFQSEIISSPIKKIKVKELPTEGLTKDFSGAVGVFEVQHSIQEAQAKVNEPLSYRITFKGSGHPQFISLPELEFPSSVQAYPPVEKSHFSEQGMGTKEFEILIIPKQEGNLTLPSSVISTFNPKSGQYVFHKLPELSFNVQKGQNNEDLGQSFLEKETATEEKNLSYKALTAFYWPQFITYRNLILFFIAFFSFLLMVLIFLYVKNFILKKEMPLKKQISQKLQVVEKSLKQKDWKKACTQMIELNTFVLSLAQSHTLSSSWRQAVQSLPPSLNKKHSFSFEHLFKQLESLSFSVKTPSEKIALIKAESLFEQTKKLSRDFLSDLSS